MYFNSFDLRHKSRFGAIPRGESICFFVNSNGYDYAYILIRKGTGEYVRKPMQKGADSRFIISVPFDETGVFFYRFILCSENGAEVTLYRGADGTATFEPPFDWQQTVFDENYTTPDWVKGGLIYQIFPDRFYKADTELPTQYEDRVYVDWDSSPCFTNGNKGLVINNDYFGGNLMGICEKLPYLKCLGVTTIYLNPIFEAHSNHRYNTADYMKVDSTLGTNEHFKILCENAKKQGIHIILDGVFSHTGADSIYFNKENRYNSVGAYNSTESKYSSWYKFMDWPEKYHSWWGFETLPEVNELDESFAEFITGENGVIDYWMSLGADGFRLDVADELPDEFIVKIRNAIKRNNKDGLLIGEVWEDASNKESYSKLREYLLGSELDSVMNYPFANEIIKFVRYGGGVDFMNRVMQIIENYPKQSLDVMMNLLSTHDTERLITALAGEPANNRDREWQSRVSLTDEQWELGEKRVKIAAILQYTLPGVPSLYYGDELLMEGYRDPFNRASFKWEKATDDNSVLNFFRVLGVLRNTCPALKDGSFIKAQYNYNGISYIRAKKDSELLVMANPSAEDYCFWLPPEWENDVVLIGDGKPEDNRMIVKPYSAVIMGRGKWTDEFLSKIGDIYSK